MNRSNFLKGMGIGMALIVAPEQVDAVMAALVEAGEEPLVIGKIVEGSGIVRYEDEE